MTRVVPITPIHRLYTQLRSCSTCAAHERILNGYRENPQSLIKDCWDSKRRFNTYLNEEKLIDRPRCINRDKARQTFRNFTMNCGLRTGWNILWGMRAQQQFRVDSGQLDFRYVEHDVRGRRTTRSRYDDGRAATDSGAGGMDAFLLTADNMPAVAEFKAPNDTDFFLCFIQALMYAVEQSSRNQYERVRRWLRDYDIELPERLSPPFVDVYLVIVEDRPRLYDATQELVEKLYEDTSSDSSNVAGIVRRTACLQASMQDDELRFQRRFVFPDDLDARELRHSIDRV